MKGNNFIQKITAVTLVSIIAISMMGCGGASKNGGASAKESAKGRYVETAMSLPLGEGERILDLIRTQDGVFELYSAKTEGENTLNKAYRYDGTDWNEESKFTAQGLPEGSTLCHAAYGKDGTLYVVFYTGGVFKSHFGRFLAGNPMEEFPLGEENSAELVSGLCAKGDDAVIVPAEDQVFIIDGSGKIVNRLPQKNPLSDSCNSYTLTAHSFLTVGDRGFVRYNSDDWKEEETIPFQNDQTDINGCLAAGEGDDLYLVNKKGLHHMADKGTMWETIADGSLNSIGMQTVVLQRLFVGNNNDFYLWYYEDGQPKLAHYTYDPNMPSMPSKTIKVYGLDLSRNRSLAQAASLFQMENPDVKIEMADGIRESGGTSKADVIRALNAELLNGAGADVLVLDGLPTDSYVEKGILDDLSEVITPMVKSGELHPDIAKGFINSDGSIGQYPIRVLMPVVYGIPDVIKATSSLEALKDWQEANPNEAIFPKTLYENILRQLIYLYYTELKNHSDNGLDGEKIQLLLETAKIVGDASGCQLEFDESVDSDREGIYDTVSVDGSTDTTVCSLLTGNASAAIEKKRGMATMMFPFAVVEKYGYQLSQFNDIYYPNGLLGIVSNGKEKAEARNFVKFALSLKVQESDLLDGFPVNKMATEAWVRRTLEGGIEKSYGGAGESISAEYPNEQERSEVMGMLDKLHTPVIMDDTLLEMIVSETKEYFEGTQTAAEASETFMNKAKLYTAG